MKKKDNYLLHIGLFIATFITTTIAGAFWTTGRSGPYEFQFLANGLMYSVAILFIISCHEFGHYFAARYHKIDATLPFYIPFPPIPIFLNFGTMGAVIRTRTVISRKKEMFDIGVAGPLAGFVACLIVLIYGFMTLPPVNYLLAIHPDFYSPEYGKGAMDLSFGNTLLFTFFEKIFVHKNQFFPPMSEIYHYPMLCVGWFGLFITSMNMIPVGQLDGGHIGYTLFGEKAHYKIAVISLIILFILGVGGILETFMPLPFSFGWSGWLVWSFILFFIIKVKHPPIPDYTELDGFRKMLGYLSYFILIVSFSPSPFVISGI